MTQTASAPDGAAPGQPITRADCAALDAADPLAPFRDRFDLPPGVIYLDGNSLGALPRDTAARVEAVLRQQWGRDLIRSWTLHGWIDLPGRIGDKIGRLIGAGPGQVVAADSTSINVFKVIAGALRLNPGRRVVLSEPGNFPTDLYMVHGLSDLLGPDRCELRLVEPSRIADAIDQDTAAVMLTHVDFRSGAVFDMEGITARAHERGALAIWDLAHSAGALPVELDTCGADLAVGCGYKYLNGGPGAPAFVYVARRHHDGIRQPLAGWLGHASPFAFDTSYSPAGHIGRMLCGTPVVLGMAALEAGVDLWLEADMGLVRRKSQELGDLFIHLVEQECAGFGLRLASPRDSSARGSQVALAHPEGYAVMQALISSGVVGDFRAPDLLRFGFTPLYTSYSDIWDAVACLRRVLDTGAWRQDRFRTRAAVT